MFSDQIQIEPVYRDQLAACGLDSVAKALQRIDGRVVAWSRTTETIYVPSPAGAPGFYLKRYLYPRWKNRIRGLMRGTFFGVHRAEAEAQLLNGMRSLGIPAVRPVAYGCRRVAHFVSACFLITEEVPYAENLTVFAKRVQAGEIPLSPRRRRAMAERLAEQVAELHIAAFAHGQLFWRNILARIGLTGDPEFFFLDARPRRGRRRLGRTPHWWLQELAQLLVSAKPFTTRTDRMRFAAQYYGARKLPNNVKDQIREIAQLAQRWERHESQRIKMGELFEAWERQLRVEAPELTVASPDAALQPDWARSASTAANAGATSSGGSPR